MTHAVLVHHPRLHVHEFPPPLIRREHLRDGALDVPYKAVITHCMPGEVVQDRLQLFVYLSGGSSGVEVDLLAAVPWREGAVLHTGLTVGVAFEPPAEGIGVAEEDDEGIWKIQVARASIELLGVHDRLIVAGAFNQLARCIVLHLHVEYPAAAIPDIGVEADRLGRPRGRRAVLWGDDRDLLDGNFQNAFEKPARNVQI